MGANLISTPNKRLDVSELNYRATILAMEHGAFHRAAEFCEKGLDLLSENVRQDNFDLTMKLSVALTRCNSCCGRLEACVKLADVVLKKAKSFCDKHMAYQIKILTLYQLK